MSELTRRYEEREGEIEALARKRQSTNGLGFSLSPFQADSAMSE